MKVISIKSKTVYVIALLLLLGTSLTFGSKDVAAQEPLLILSDDLLTALEPGGPVDFDRILAEQDSAWADFRQSDHGEIRSAGIIFHETAFGPELGTGVNPAVILVTYGVERNWELPANGDLVSEVDRIRAVLHQHELDWILGKVDQSQYPMVANGATYVLYRYFDGDLSMLEAWSSNFETLFGVSPNQTTVRTSTFASTSSNVVTPFLQRPFDQLEYPFHYVTSFFDHHYPLYDAEGVRTDMSRFDGTFFENIPPGPDACGYDGDTGSGNYCYSGHPAYDYSISDVPVKAAAAGHIVECSSDYGALWIEHENGLITSYLHMDPLYIPNGIPCAQVSTEKPFVEQGQIIGNASDKHTGGKHLHFGVGYEATTLERQNIDPFGWWGDEPDPWESYDGSLFDGLPSSWLWIGDEVGDGYLTVDNMETQAQLFNAPSSMSDWNHLNAGYQNDSWWSHLSYQPTRTSVYWGIWGVNINQPGVYQVQAYWPADPDTQDFPVPTQKATYTLYYHDVQGNIQSATLYADQSRNADQFTTLCAVPYENESDGCPEYPQIQFGSGSSVLILRDVSEESIESGKYMVFFDAVRWDQKVRDLAFVIDDTGSMEEEIDIVKTTTNELVDLFVEKGLNPTYHLITYKDFPDVYYVGGTSNPPTFKGWVNNLSASGGWSCPEEMLGALQLTAEKAPHSEALVMTDAEFHGGAPEIAATASKLNMADVNVHIIRYGSCYSSYTSSSAVGGQENETQDNSGYKVEQSAGTSALISGELDPFAQITSETGGHYFRIVTSETDAAVKILLNEMVTTSNLAHYTDEVLSGSPKTYSVSIDSTTTEANFLLNMYSGSGSLTLINPNGIPVNPSDPGVIYTAVSNATYYQIANPVVGVWQAQISGDGSFALSTSGNSSISFEYLSDTSLAKDEAVNLLASLTGPVASASFQFVHPDGTLLQTINLFDDGLHGDGLANDGVYGGTYTPTTAGSFYFRVEGTTTDSTEFERIATEMIRVQTMSVVAPADQPVSPGTTLVYDFSIINGGTVDETYDLVIASSQGWADLSGVPGSVTVLAGATEHILIPVNVPITAVEGLMDDLVLTAVSQLNPLVHDSDSVQTTVIAPPNDLIFADGFESGNFSAWYWADTDGGDLSASVQAAAIGNYGMQAIVDDTVEITVEDRTPNNEKHYSARFYLNPNDINIASGGIQVMFASQSDFCLYLNQEGANYSLMLCGKDDAGSWLENNPVLITDAWQAVEIEWQASSAPGANDGFIKLWVGDTLVSSIENVDNDSRAIASVWLGAMDIASGASGTLYFDGFASHQGSHIGLDPNEPSVYVPGPLPDPIFADGFESGDLSGWSSTVTDGGDLSVSASAAYQSNYGLRALINDTSNLIAVDASPVSEPHYRTRFYFNPNLLTMSSGNAHFIFDGMDIAVNATVSRVELIRESGAYKLRAKILNDAYTYLNTSKFTISNGWHVIEIEWQASSAPGANNGFLTLWIDGTLKQTLSNVDNDMHTIGEVRLGATAGLDAGTSGSMYFDKFESRRNTYIGP